MALPSAEILTAAEFRSAAEEFSAVGGELRGLAVAIDSMDPHAVLRGGELGRVVPERLGSCADMAAAAAADAETAAQLCGHRAAVMAAYEAELAAYDRALAEWELQANAYEVVYPGTSTFGVPDPPIYVLVPAPPPPIPPPPPPYWARVRRGA